jgi:hypothetical protein
MIEDSPSQMQEPALREDRSLAPADFLTKPPTNFIKKTDLLGANPTYFLDF